MQAEHASNRLLEARDHLDPRLGEAVPELPLAELLYMTGVVWFEKYDCGGLI